MEVMRGTAVSFSLILIVATHVT